MNYVRSSNPSLKYQRFTPSGCRDIVLRNFEFVAKTQFLSPSLMLNKRILICYESIIFTAKYSPKQKQFFYKNKLKNSLILLQTK